MKRKERRKRKQKYIVNFMLCFIIIGIIFWVGIQFFIEYNIKNFNDSYMTQKLNLNQNTNKNESIHNSKIEELYTNKYPKENILQSYKGQEVCRKIRNRKN